MDLLFVYTFITLIFTLDDTVDPSDIEEGDHIYRWSCIFGLKCLKTHTHHAIVIKKTGNLPENILVIEFMRNAQSNETTLQKVTLEEFIKSGHHKTIHRVTYQENYVRHLIKRRGCSSMETPLSPRKVVERALILYEVNSAIREPAERIYLFYMSHRIYQTGLDSEESPIDMGPWTLITNNCECCVRWCKVGKWNSLQARNGILLICTAIISIVIYIVTSELDASWLVGKTLIEATILAFTVAVDAYAAASKRFDSSYAKRPIFI